MGCTGSNNATKSTPVITTTPEEDLVNSLPPNAKALGLEILKYKKQQEWKDFQINSMVEVQTPNAPLYDLKFRAETTESFLHLIHTLLYMLKDHQMQLQTLLIVGLEEKKPELKAKLTEECFDLLKTYLHFGGFMYLKEFELNGYRAGFPHAIMCKFILLLENNPVLEIIRLTDLNIDAECGAKIVKIIGRNTALKHLCLTQNHLMADFVLGVSKLHLNHLDVEVEQFLIFPPSQLDFS